MVPLILRRSVEYFSRGISFNRRLPKRFGALKLHVSPGAALCYYKSLTSPNWNDLYDFAEEYVKAGDTVWDIGANMGVFTFAAASRAGAAGRVLALEPDSWSINHLRHSIRLNQDRNINVDVVQVAISDSLAIQTFNIPTRNRAASHLAAVGGAGRDLIGRTRERQLVVCVSLDWLAEQFESPAVLKIDVDGGEMSVLGGASSLITRHRPIILIEVYERNADTVTKFLHRLNYEIFDFNFGLAGKSKIDRAVYNTLAIPVGT